MHGAGIDLADRLAAALRPLLPGLVAVAGLKRLTGGSSHDTWAFDARLEEGGLARVQSLILRREFAAPLFEMSLEAEFLLLQRLSTAGLKVPRPLLCTQLGELALVMERIDGPDARKLMAQPPSGLDRPALGRAIVAEQARIHGIDVTLLDGIVAGSQGDSFAGELAKWGAMIDAAQVASPALIIARDWLETNYPGPIDDTVIVHGDFKANNILVRGGYEPVIIDWELAHVGDRHEDLAWTVAWTSPHDLVGGMLSSGEFLDIYAQLSGRTVDRRRLRFWQMFALVKLAAIFLKGLEPRLRGEPVQPLHLMLGQAVPRLERAILDMLLAGENG